MRKIKVTNKSYEPNNIIPNPKIDPAKSTYQICFNFYKSFDLFGKPVTLRFQGEDTYKSVVGATISLSIFAIMIGYFVYSLIFFVDRKTPIFSSVTEVSTSPEPINFNNYFLGHFTAGIAIQNNSAKRENLLGSLYNFNVSHIVKTNFVSFDDSNAEIIDCHDAFNSSSNSNQTYFSLFRMDHAQCFSLGAFSNNNISLSGTSITDSESYISIKINIIPENATILHTPNGAILYYYVNQNVFDINSSSKNISIHNSAFYSLMISKKMIKTYDLQLGNDTIIDYFDISKPNPSFILSYNQIWLDVDFNDDMSFEKAKTLLELNIKLARQKTTYTRKYTSVKEYLVDLIGIMNGIFMFGTIVGQKFNSILMKIDLINRSFSIISDTIEHKKDRSEPKMLTPDSRLNNISKDGRTVILNQKKEGLNDWRNKDKKSYVDNSKTADNYIEEKSKINFDDSPKHNLIDQNEKKYPEVQEMEEKIKNEFEKIQNPFRNNKKMIINKLKKFSPFEMSFWELIRMLIPCCHSHKVSSNNKIFDECGLYIESFFDIEKIIAIFREYQEFRTVVLSSEEYKVLFLLTKPKIEISVKNILLRKAQKVTVSDDININYIDFMRNINRMLKLKYLTNIEYNLLDLHRIEIEQEIKLTKNFN